MEADIDSDVNAIKIKETTGFLQYSYILVECVIWILL